MFTSFLIFIVAFAALVRSGSILVRSLSALSRILGISEYATAFILMAGATSLPELFIGISSAFSGFPELSLGNVLGANFLNITLVLGAVAIIGNGLTVREPVRSEDVRMIFVLTVIPFLLALDGAFGRVDGIIMIVLFIGYLLELFEESRERESLMMAHASLRSPVSGFGGHAAAFIGGIVLMLVSAYFVVYSGTRLAGALELSSFLFGVVLLSLGSTLPELVFGVRSALLKEGALGLGNVIGSVVFNTLFILGVVAVIHPIVFPDRAAVLQGFVSVSLLILFVQALTYLKGSISRRVGVFLLILYVVFLIYQLV
ncbi:MAG: sodium:calcium antiporter [bacterium]|nr:sodium:calcium antiporter [bacterium]